MLGLGAISFAVPWLLFGLLALPILWLLLRLMPPAPKRLRFPAIRLLFGLEAREETPASAPWWLVLLRLSIAGLAVLAAAGPLLDAEALLDGEGPVILVVDDGWRAAPDWQARQAALLDIAARAERANRPIALITGADASDGTPAPEQARLSSAADARQAIRALEPKAWPLSRLAMTRAVEALLAEGEANGAASPGQATVFWAPGGAADPEFRSFAETLSALGPVSVLAPGHAFGPYIVGPPPATATDLSVTIRRALDAGPRRIAVIARAEDGRPLLRREALFEDGQTTIEVPLPLPDELRNALSSATLASPAAGDGPIETRAVDFGASATLLFDDRWRRRSIGIITESGTDGGLALLSEVYFLARAAAPAGTISRADTTSLLKAGQSLLLLPDETPVGEADRAALSDWVETGGVLMRFAGPKLASAGGDSLTPVTLRIGGRQLSGAMQWTKPARIGKAAPDGPLAGLRLPEDVTITRQVLAEPTPELDSRTWLRLEDDTPLVTASRRGDGWLVLVHTTANSEWSSLALSGLFVDILERMAGLARGVGTSAYAAPLPALRTMDGFGRLNDPAASAGSFTAGADEIEISAALPPGYYGREGAKVALSIGDLEQELLPLDLAGLEADGYIAAIESLARAPEKPLAAWLWTAALILLLLDGALSLWLRGLKPRAPRVLASARGPIATIIIAGVLAFPLSDTAHAQQNDDSFAIRASANTVLAYVKTGDPNIDEVSRAGLRGLSTVLRQRTAVEAVEPMGVDPSQDDLAFFPILYWPVTEEQTPPDGRTADRINSYLASGGTILFDTRDGHRRTSMTRVSPALARLARDLDVPALKPVGPEHVLTRSFYLMQDFPGRWVGGTLWVEDGAGAEHDGVSRVLVGDADWAAAWALDEAGRSIYPIVPGGKRQRELSFRFGINLVMYMLTGNYKADQVHIPAILERLGQ